jgi:Tfp pilus assembly protein PilX
MRKIKVPIKKYAGMKTKLLPAKRGSILAYSLIILSMMLLIAVGMSFVTVTEKKNASTTDSSVQSYQTADNGVQLAIKKIKDNAANPVATITGVFGSCSVNANGFAQVTRNDAGPGTYTLTFYSDQDAQSKIADCSKPINTIHNIKSIGAYTDTVRAVQVAIAAGSTAGVTGGCTLNTRMIHDLWGAGCQADSTLVSAQNCTLAGDATHSCGVTGINDAGNYAACICVSK